MTRETPLTRRSHNLIEGYIVPMELVVLLLLIAAVVCFGLATFNVVARLNLMAAGLLCWALSALVPLLAAL